MYIWRKAKHIMRDKPIFLSERMLHRDFYRRGSVENKNYGRGLKGLDTKTNWLAVKRQSLSNFNF
jgi:hypothetical protein